MRAVPLLVAAPKFNSECNRYSASQFASQFQ
jgi:hypothetical protein